MNLFLPDAATIDQRSRWVLMSAYLYYRRASPVLPDAYYDRLTLELSRSWDKLSPTRQWQFGSADELKATGHHIKVTRLVEGGAIAWHNLVKGMNPGGYCVSSGEWSANLKGSWVTAESAGVTVTKSRPRKRTDRPPKQLELF